MPQKTTFLGSLSELAVGRPEIYRDRSVADCQKYISGLWSGRDRVKASWTWFGTGSCLENVSRVGIARYFIFLEKSRDMMRTINITALFPLYLFIYIDVKYWTPSIARIASHTHNGNDHTSCQPSHTAWLLASFARNCWHRVSRPELSTRSEWSLISLLWIGSIADPIPDSVRPIANSDLCPKNRDTAWNICDE